MHSHRHRVSHHSHHSSLSHFEDIKVLQAELARHSHFDAIDAPPRTISSAQSTPQVQSKHALETIASRPHSSARFVPATWNPGFLDKPASYKRYLVAHPADYPVCTLHLAAIAIQRWWRRLGRARRTKRSRRRIEHVPTWQHPWQSLVRSINDELSSSEGRPAAASSVSSRQQLMQHAVSLNDYCASVIQRAWRASRERRYRRYLRRPMYRIAAGSIQRWWRERLIELGNKRSVRVMAATTIQRAYRQFADRKIYRFFRQLLLSREHANPLLLLRTLQAREQTLADPSSGLYVRLRLGGASFPPLIYYKVFTTQHVTDIGSFAPRDYAADDRRRREARKATPGGPAAAHAEDGDRTDVQYWYRRWENNGWRVVGGQLLLEHREDDIERSSAAVRTYHHPNKHVRRVEAERRRKERRIEWMKQLYARGRQREGQSEQKEEAKELMDVYQVTRSMDALIGQSRAERRRLEEEAKAAAEGLIENEEEEEEDVDSLIDWASQLCFDEYERQWTRAGVTRPAQRDKSTT